jgi:hypothetical protein
MRSTNHNQPASLAANRKVTMSTRVFADLRMTAAAALFQKTPPFTVTAVAA